MGIPIDFEIGPDTRNLLEELFAKPLVLEMNGTTLEITKHFIVAINNLAKSFRGDKLSDNPKLNAILTALETIKRKLDTMPTTQDVDTKIDDIMVEVDKIGADLAVELENLRREIAAGHNLVTTFAKLDALAGKLQGVDDLIDESSVLEPVPTPEPVPAQPNEPEPVPTNERVPFA